MEVTLPLVYANGRFAHLDEMTDSQMERFITFLIRCSCGYDTTLKVYEPEWWLPNLPFVYPLARPKKVTGKWKSDLKNLIQRCYKHHKYEYLLNLSKYLWEHQQKGNIIVSPIENTSETRSVYLKNNDTVIATIRNINVTYDESLVKFVDRSEHDLVPETYQSSELEQIDFLKYFNLRQKDEVFVPINEPRELNCIPSRTFYNSTNIPFSSQLGRRLAIRSKYFVNEKTHLKRLERINRYLNMNSTPSDVLNDTVQTCLKYKLINCWSHNYKFKTGAKNNWNMKTKILYNSCKDCEVRIIPLKDTVIMQMLSSKQNKDESDCAYSMTSSNIKDTKENTNNLNKYLPGREKSTKDIIEKTYTKEKITTRSQKTNKNKPAENNNDYIQKVSNSKNGENLTENVEIRPNLNIPVISTYTNYKTEKPMEIMCLNSTKNANRQRTKGTHVATSNVSNDCKIDTKSDIKKRARRNKRTEHKVMNNKKIKLRSSGILNFGKLRILRSKTLT